MSNLQLETKQFYLTQLSGSTNWNQVSGEVSIALPSNIISATAFVQAIELWNSRAYSTSAIDGRIISVSWSSSVVTCFISAGITPGFKGDKNSFDPSASYMRIVVIAECE